MTFGKLYMDVHLKNGQTLNIEVENFEITKGKLDGELRGLSYTMKGNAKIKYLDLAEVAAITSRRGWL